MKNKNQPQPQLQSALWPAFSRIGHSNYASYAMTFNKGEGAYLYDTNGNRYFDAFSTLWTNLIGHGRQEVIDAMAEQQKLLSFMHLFTGTSHEPAIKLAEKLISMSPFDHKKVFFGLSGSDATETAMKLARIYWRAKGKPSKNIIIGRDSGYHGTSFGALSLMGSRSYQEPYLPLVPRTELVAPSNCYRCPFNKKPESCQLECAEAFIKRFSELNALENVAAILIEPVITSDGLVLPPHHYWKNIQDLCRKHDVLIIADEVSTGMGRTGTLYSSSSYGLMPDIAYLAKSLTSGYAPLSATTVSKEIFDTVNSSGLYFSHGSTFGGHPASCIAALKTIEIFEREDLLDRANRLGTVLYDALHSALDDCDIVGNISIAGTLCEIELVSDKTTKQGFDDELNLGFTVYQELLKRGFYVRCLGRFLCIAPPLISDEAEIWALGKAIRGSLEGLKVGL